MPAYLRRNIFVQPLLCEIFALFRYTARKRIEQNFRPILVFTELLKVQIFRGYAAPTENSF